MLSTTKKRMPVKQYATPHSPLCMQTGIATVLVALQLGSRRLCNCTVTLMIAFMVVFMIDWPWCLASNFGQPSCSGPKRLCSPCSSYPCMCGMPYLAVRVHLYRNVSVCACNGAWDYLPVDAPPPFLCKCLTTLPRGGWDCTTLENMHTRVALQALVLS